MSIFLETFEKHLIASKNREKIWKRVCDLEFFQKTPKSIESFQYVPLHHLYEMTFASPKEEEVTFSDIEEAIFPECSHSCLVFVNGIFAPHLSRTQELPASFLVMPLSQAEGKFDAFFEGRYEVLLREERDPFALLNYASYREGVFLYLPPKICVAKPVQILHVYQSGLDAPLFSPRISFFLGRESRCDLYTTELYLGEQQGWSNGVFDIVLEEKAHLNLSTLFSLGEKIIQTDAVRAQLRRESCLKALTFGLGKKVFRQDFSLNAYQGSSSTLAGALLLHQKREAHIHTLVNHKEARAHSLQKFKGILNDQSRMSFTGKIHVCKEAEQTQAYQLNNNLLLSDFARVYSKPNLEIFADDVKASHGATMGRLNKEDLFYLQAKGLPESLARRLLIKGFYQEIANLILLPSAKRYLKTIYGQLSL